MSKKPNQRADVKNPNNPAYKAAVDNRSVQLNEQAAIKKAAASQIESTEKI